MRKKWLFLTIAGVLFVAAVLSLLAQPDGGAARADVGTGRG